MDDLNQATPEMVVEGPSGSFELWPDRVIGRKPKLTLTSKPTGDVKVVEVPREEATISFGMGSHSLQQNDWPKLTISKLPQDQMEPMMAILRVADETRKQERKAEQQAEREAAEVRRQDQQAERHAQRQAERDARDTADARRREEREAAQARRQAEREADEARRQERRVERKAKSDAAAADFRASLQRTRESWGELKEAVGGIPEAAREDFGSNRGTALQRLQQTRITDESAPPAPGVVRHNRGTIGMEGDHLVARTFGEGWSNPPQGWPLGQCTVEFAEGNRRGFKPALVVRDAYGDAYRFEEVGPPEEVERLIQQVGAAIGPPPRYTGYQTVPAGQLDQVAPAPRREVKVVTYKDAKDYERNAPKMARQGWIPEGQLAGRGRTSLTGTAVKGAFTGGFGLALTGRARKGERITVTWVRGG